MGDVEFGEYPGPLKKKKKKPFVQADVAARLSTSGSTGLGECLAASGAMRRYIAPRKGS